MALRNGQSMVPPSRHGAILPGSRGRKVEGMKERKRESTHCRRRGVSALVRNTPRSGPGGEGGFSSACVVAEPLLVSIPEAAACLGIGRTKMFELVKSGAVPAVAIGRRRLVRVDLLRSYVDRLASDGSSGESDR
jgi:excisionase family DNA binding protein